MGSLRNLIAATMTRRKKSAISEGCASKNGQEMAAWTASEPQSKGYNLLEVNSLVLKS